MHEQWTHIQLSLEFSSMSPQQKSDCIFKISLHLALPHTILVYCYGFQSRVDDNATLQLLALGQNSDPQQPLINLETC